MKNIALTIVTTDQVSKNLVRLGEAFKKTPEIKIPLTKLEKFRRDVCVYFSVYSKTK